LSGHLSSSEGWAKHDIGMNSDWKHDHYKKHCPDGYELIWIDEPEDSEEINQAYVKNRGSRKAQRKPTTNNC